MLEAATDTSGYKRARGSFFPNKYHFNQLAVGESMIVPGAIKNIRSAASQWGTRYGVWLSVNPTKEGALVTRNESPVRMGRKRQEKHNLEQRLQRIEDGIRFLCVQLVKVSQALDKS